MKKLATALCMMFFLLSVGEVANAIPWNEGPDAGELIDTAQATHGPKSLDYITGVLTGNDIDLYQIYINDTNDFSVTVLADLSYVGDYDDDNDAVLYLFDSEGYQVLWDDDSDYPLPKFEPGLISDKDTGIYYLAFAAQGSFPYFSDFAIYSWHYTTSPQTGNYTLFLTGAAPAHVSEPATIFLFGSGFIGIAGIIRKRFRT